MCPGEIAAIQNCTAILTDPTGPYNLTGTQAIAAFADLTLYTNAESCPMVRTELPVRHALYLLVGFRSAPPRFAGLASESTSTGRASRRSSSEVGAKFASRPPT